MIKKTSHTKSKVYTTSRGFFARQNWKIICFLSAFFLFLDQATKTLAQKQFQLPYHLFGTSKYSNLFTLQYSENTAIAFSIPLPQIVPILLTIIAVPLVIYSTPKEFDLSKKITKIALSLFIAGAIGNFLDRLIHGFVIDFISVWRWPIFNLADAYITIAVLLIMIFYQKIKHTSD